MGREMTTRGETGREGHSGRFFTERDLLRSPGATSGRSATSRRARRPPCATFRRNETRKIGQGTLVFHQKDLDRHAIGTHAWARSPSRDGKTEPYASIREAVYRTFSRHMDIVEDDLLMAWPLDSNRKLAESYYERMQEDASR